LALVLDSLDSLVRRHRGGLDLVPTRPQVHNLNPVSGGVLAPIRGNQGDALLRAHIALQSLLRGERVRAAVTGTIGQPPPGSSGRRRRESHSLVIHARTAPDLTERGTEVLVHEPGQRRRVLDLVTLGPRLLSVL